MTIAQNPNQTTAAEERRVRRRLAGALAAAAGIYAGILALMPARVFWSPDEGGRFLQMAGWKVDGGLAHYRVPYGGAGRDPAYRFYPGAPACPQPRGRAGARAAWPFWFPLLTAPFYRAFGCAGLYLVPLGAGLLAALIAGVFAERMCAGAGAPGLLAAALATPLVIYSRLYWEHTLQVCLCLAALLCALRARGAAGRSARYWIAGVIALVAAALLRAETLVFAVALVAAAAFTPAPTADHAIRARRARSVFRAALGIALLAALAVALTPLLRKTDAAGWSPFRNRDFGRTLVGGLERLFDPGAWAYFPSHAVGLLITPVATAGATAAGTPAGMKIPLAAGWALCGFNGLALCWLSGAMPRGLRFRAWLLGAGMLGAASAAALLIPERYRAVHGLFLATPFLAVASLRVEGGNRPAGADALVPRTAWLYLAAHALVTLVIRPPARGLEWGPRYALSVYPLLAAAAAAALARFAGAAPPRRRSLAIGAAALLLAISCGFAARGVNELRVTKRDLLACDARIREAGVPVVTDNPWLPCFLAVTFAEQEMFVASDGEALRAWIAGAAENTDAFLLVSRVNAPWAPPAEEETGARLKSRTTDGKTVFSLYRIGEAAKQRELDAY